MKVITYQTKKSKRERTRGFKDSDLHSLANNKAITIISVKDVEVSPGEGLSAFLAWARQKLCGS